MIPGGLAGVGFVAVCVGFIKLFGATGGASVDPSQRATLIADGANSALSVVAFGALTFAAGVVWLIVLAVASVLRAKG
jgi:hypothetical protein